MKKSVISAEEHKKFEEERQRPYRLEITDIGNDTFSIKSPILLSKEKYELLQKLCDITGEHLQEYIKNALLTMVKTDLENPSEIGQAVCKTLLEKWNEV
jgi:hypothetical protein